MQIQTREKRGGKRSDVWWKSSTRLIIKSKNQRLAALSFSLENYMVDGCKFIDKAIAIIHRSNPSFSLSSSGTAALSFLIITALAHSIYFPVFRTCFFFVLRLSATALHSLRSPSERGSEQRRTRQKPNFLCLNY